MNAISTSIQGNATQDAAIHRFEDGGCRTGFTVAVNDTYYDPRDGEWKERKPEFVRVQVRRKSLAENVARSVKKGMPVLVSGRLVTNEWVDREGGRRTELTLHADNVGVELTHGSVSYEKNLRQVVDENTGEVRSVGEADDAFTPAPSGTDSEPADSPLVAA